MAAGADYGAGFDCPVLHADPNGCPVMVGMAHNATQDVLVCNRPMPCWEHARWHASPTDGSEVS